MEDALGILGIGISPRMATLGCPRDRGSLGDAMSHKGMAMSSEQGDVAQETEGRDRRATDRGIRC